MVNPDGRLLDCARLRHPNVLRAGPTAATPGAGWWRVPLNPPRDAIWHSRRVFFRSLSAARILLTYWRMETYIRFLRATAGSGRAGRVVIAGGLRLASRLEVETDGAGFSLCRS
jgi:hypothetical protein